MCNFFSNTGRFSPKAWTLPSQRHLLRPQPQQAAAAMPELVTAEASIAFGVAIGPAKHGQPDRLTKPCVVINPHATVEEVAQLFATHQLLRAPVIQGKLLGMITVTDLLSYYPAIAQPHLEVELHYARHQATRICTAQEPNRLPASLLECSGSLASRFSTAIGRSDQRLREQS
jgi:CBS domain